MTVLIPGIVDTSPKKKEQPSYWTKEVFIDQGWCYGIQLVEVDPVDGKRQWHIRHIYLGTEAEILPILKGDQPIPEGMEPVRKAILEKALEVNADGADGNESSEIGRRGLQRGSNAGASRHRQSDLGPTSARERLSSRATHHQEKSVPGK